jgi:acyl-CoA thioester hydrolase
MSELPITYRGVVYPWQCDHMNHMNVMWYVGKFDEATWNLLALFGMTPSSLKEMGVGMVAVKQEIAYKREVLAGETVTIRSGVLEVRAKSVRFFHEMTNNESGEVAAVTVLTGVQIDAGTRKSCPFQEDVLVRGRSMVTSYDPGI